VVCIVAVLILVAATFLLPGFAVRFGFLLLPIVFLITAMSFSPERKSF